MHLYLTPVRITKKYTRGKRPKGITLI